MSLPLSTGLFLPHPGGVQASLEHARWAEAQGFDGLWAADRGDVDVLTLAGAIAAATRKVRLGFSVVPAQTRTPAVLAATAATLAALAPGRVVLGLGASSPAMVEGWHGLSWDRPLTRVRETVTLLRAMLAGEKSDFTGRTLRSHGYRLAIPPAQSVPIVLGGMRPRSMALAGELGDGVAFNMTPLRAVAPMLQHAAEGAAKSGRDPAALEVIANIKVAITDDPAAVREEFRRRWWGYYVTPVYNEFLAWSGFPAEAAAVRAAWQHRDRAGVQAALSDEMVDALVMTGDAATCRAKLEAFVEAGVTTPVIFPVTDDPSAYREICAAFVPPRCSAHSA